MESHEVAELFDQAVRDLRRATELDEAPDEGWELLCRAADSGHSAVRLAVGHLADPDGVVRAAACDLLGLAGDVHGDDLRAEAAVALISLAANETDPEVQWSIARALGATGDPRALPTLADLAGSPDTDVRFRVAVSLPAVLDDPPAEAGEAVLIELCTDSVPKVREWATFGLGWTSSADGVTVRQALWDRTQDTDPEVRAEGVRGLARRRDPRALPLLRELLAEDEVHRFTFQAAAYLADPSLLPLLNEFDPDAPGVAEALLEVTRRGVPSVTMRPRGSWNSSTCNAPTSGSPCSASVSTSA
ncbi:hypothetical protein GCM10027614_70450 [Micromonospora vulcania]